jgi:hypothetical protein
MCRICGQAAYTDRVDTANASAVCICKTVFCPEYDKEYRIMLPGVAGQFIPSKKAKLHSPFPKIL